jgi:hypothetical protein
MTQLRHEVMCSRVAFVEALGPTAAAEADCQVFEPFRRLKAPRISNTLTSPFARPFAINDRANQFG